VLITITYLAIILCNHKFY